MQFGLQVTAEIVDSKLEFQVTGGQKPGFTLVTKLGDYTIEIHARKMGGPYLNRYSTYIQQPDVHFHFMKINYNWHMTFALVSKANNRNRSIRYRMRSFQNLSLVRRQPIINPNGVAVFCYGKEPCLI